ncbi:MAG: hypothetical protein HN849_02850 [Victivallales bacterium]|nr:hypothetical protein [Victivallales bacterium]MBT7298420.1 hypothetical protein [Victivallales bacterium]
MNSNSCTSTAVLPLMACLCLFCHISAGRDPLRPSLRRHSRPRSPTVRRWAPRSTGRTGTELPPQPNNPELDYTFDGELQIPTEFGAITYGFVLRNGEELPPPFDFDVSDGSIWLNGQAICAVDDATAPRPDLPFDRWQEVGETPLLASIRVALADHGLLVLESGAKPCVVEGPGALSALLVLSGGASVEQKLGKLGGIASDGAKQVDWASVVETFTPSSTFSERLDTAALYHESLTGQKRMGRQMLLVGGLLLTVLALGGLFHFRPVPQDQLVVKEVASRTALVCVALLMTLNLYDLVATVYTCVPGGVTELNPVARKMLRTPLLLSLSKLVAVGGGCAAIWWFRQQRVASMAVWWLSLAYTVVVFHWTVCQYILLV